MLNIKAKVFPWCYTKTQNLGQKYQGTGVRKYKSTNEKGEPTGVGYAFEDLTKIRWEEQGHKVEQVPTMKNVFCTLFVSLGDNRSLAFIFVWPIRLLIKAPSCRA